MLSYTTNLNLAFRDKKNKSALIVPLIRVFGGCTGGAVEPQTTDIGYG